MIWLCCYTTLRPETEKALHEHVPPGDAVRLLGVAHDETAYAHHLIESWDYAKGSKSGLAIVEQDNILRADIAETFRVSPHGWVAYPYAWTTNVGPALGMTRFSGEFIARYPDAMREAASMSNAGYYMVGSKPPENNPTGAGHWKQVGYLLTDRVLRDHGERPVVYLPRCEHLNEAQTLLPEVAEMTDVEHLARLGLEAA